MDKKKYNEYIKSIKKLLVKHDRLQGQIKGINLSGSGWQDYSSADERERLYNRYNSENYDKHNKKIEDEQKEVRKTISEIIITILESGYTEDQIRKSCFYLGKIYVEELKETVALNHHWKSTLDDCFAIVHKIMPKKEEKKETKEYYDNDIIQDVIRHYEGGKSLDVNKTSKK